NARAISLRTEEESNIAERYSEYAVNCFERIKTILQHKPQHQVLVQIIVAGHREQAVIAGLSGLLKTAQLENPQIVGQVILVAAATSTEELARHLQAEKTRAATVKDELIRYEKGVRQVLRWQEVPADGEQSPIAFKEKGVYLVTGGLG